MALVTLAALAPFLLSEDETERDAVLLEVCDLPDKQLILTEADLDAIVSRFSGSVPIKLMHTDSPLDPFGVVKSVQRVGKQLLGKLSFPAAIADLVRQRGAAALSCGLDRAPLSLSEVSLVIKGRIPAACLLSDDDQAELARLRVEVQQQKVDAQVIALKLAGKIVPATEAAARVLLSAGASALITLADGASMNTAAAFAAYLAAQPALVTLGELTQLAGLADQQSIHATDEVILNTDERAWLEKSLGVKADDVAKTMTADKKKAGTGSLAGMDRPSAQMRGG